MKRVVTAGFVAALAACGGSDSQPTGPAPLTVPQFAVGSYWLSLSGYDVSLVPALPACEKPAGLPPAGKSVMVRLNVVKQGGEWVGSVADGDGDLELRFRDSGELPFGLRSLIGTLRGQAPDGGVPGSLGPRGVSIDVEGIATVEAQTSMPFSSRVVSGRVTGGLRFKDAEGRAGTCTAVSLTIFTDTALFTGG